MPCRVMIASLKTVASFSRSRMSVGNIKDGVAFDIGRGGWLIATDDFLATAELIQETRRK